MRRKLPMRAALMALAAILAGASGAAAHPSPAEPPAFFNQPCMRVVNRAQEPSFMLTYGVPVEDTAKDPDLVDLPDTKTHQFFAVAGRVFERASSRAVVPFGDPTGTPLDLPLWLSQADLSRVQQAAADHPTARMALADHGEPLEALPDLAALLFGFTSEPARVPITTKHGVRGVTWDLSDVPLGPYQIAAYIFSPPYNAWAVRPGLIQVVDDGRGPPALGLDRVAARIFQGQGRRISGCAYAPEGSTVEISVRAAASPADAFVTRLTDLPIDAAGGFEGCLLNPGDNASLQVRATLTTPTGETVHAFSVETLELFENPAGCQPSDSLCCPPGARSRASGNVGPSDAGAADAAAMPLGSPRAGDDPTEGDVDAGDNARAKRGSEDAGEPHPDASVATPADATEVSCHCHAAGATGAAGPGLALWALPIVLLMRRIRGHRPKRNGHSMLRP